MALCRSSPESIRPQDERRTQRRRSRASRTRSADVRPFGQKSSWGTVIFNWNLRSFFAEDPRRRTSALRGERAGGGIFASVSNVILALLLLLLELRSVVQSFPPSLFFVAAGGSGSTWVGSVAGIALVGSPLSPAASNAALMSIPATSFIISNAGGSAAQQKRGGARRGHVMNHLILNCDHLNESRFC